MHYDRETSNTAPTQGFDGPNRPMLTVIIPLYNKSAEVERALGSVFRQTWQNFEVIVVDDGSTDSGPDVVRRVADSRVHLLMQQNAGVAAARNRGIAAAKSDLVAFLDADDEWAPDHLETIVRLRGRHTQCEVIATSYVIRIAEGDERPAVLRGSALSSGEGVLEDYFASASRSDPPLWSSAVASTKSAILSIGGFPNGIAQGEDLLTWARLATRFSIAYATRPSAIFWQPAIRELRPTRRPEIPDRVGRALKEILDQAKPEMRASLRSYIALWHRMRGNMFLRLNDRRAARKEFAKAIRFTGPTVKLLTYFSLAHLPHWFTQITMRLASRSN